MKFVKVFTALVLMIVFSSCGKDNEFNNHKLNGIYEGQWSSNPTAVTVEIFTSDNDDNLEMRFNSFRSYEIDVISDLEFGIPRFEETGFSNQIAGELIGDTLHLQNNWYNVSDTTDAGIRLGSFARVE